MSMFKKFEQEIKQNLKTVKANKPDIIVNQLLNEVTATFHKRGLAPSWDCSWAIVYRVYNETKEVYLPRQLRR